MGVQHTRAGSWTLLAAGRICQARKKAEFLNGFSHFVTNNRTFNL